MVSEWKLFSCIKNKTWNKSTDRLGSFDGHKAVISLLPTDITKGSVVRDVLGNVRDFMDSMVVLEDLWKKKMKHEFLLCREKVNQLSLRDQHLNFKPAVAWRQQNTQSCITLEKILLQLQLQVSFRYAFASFGRLEKKNLFFQRQAQGPSDWMGSTIEFSSFSTVFHMDLDFDQVVQTHESAFI